MKYFAMWLVCMYENVMNQLYHGSARTCTSDNALARLVHAHTLRLWKVKKSMLPDAIICIYIACMHDIHEQIMFCRCYCMHIRHDFSHKTYGSHEAKRCLRASAKCTFITRTRKASFFIDTFCRFQWFCYRTAKALIRIRGCAGWLGHTLPAYARRHVLACRGPYNVIKKRLGLPEFWHKTIF